MGLRMAAGSIIKAQCTTTYATMFHEDYWQVVRFFLSFFLFLFLFTLSFLFLFSC
jgi:hypothetical protein